MRKTLPLVVVGALMLSAGAAQARPAQNPDAQIARIVDGRSPGQPIDCIYQNQVSSTEVIRHTAIVYKMNDGTIYVNRPTSGASWLQRDSVLVTDTHSSQLCSIDIVRLIDAGIGGPQGSVGLGKFVPYPRAPRSASR